MAKFIQDFILQIGKECGIKINDASLSYGRFMLHIRYMIARIIKKERLDLDMNEYCKSNFRFSYEKAEYLSAELSKLLHLEIQEVEIGYLALHIERVIKTTLEDE